MQERRGLWGIRKRGTQFVDPAPASKSEREKVQLAPATFYTTTPCLHATKERRAEKGKEKEKVETSAAGKARGKQRK